MLPVILLLSAQTPLYGDDMITLMARQLGYEERLQPCATKDGEVEVAIRATGDVVYNGVHKPAAEVAKAIHADRLDIRGVCLYVEGPMSAASKTAFRQIWSAASSSDLGVVRFADPEFSKRVFPKFRYPGAK